LSAALHGRPGLPHGRDCLYDREPVLTGEAVAARGPNGKTIGAQRRAWDITKYLVDKYAPWHWEDARIAEALQTEFRQAFAEAIIAMPLVLASPFAGLRYVAIHRDRAVGLADDGRIGMVTRVPAIAMASWSLSTSRESVFYWDRPARAAPCKDPAAEELLRRPLAQLYDATRAAWTPPDHPLAAMIEKLLWSRITPPRPLTLNHPVVMAALQRTGGQPGYSEEDLTTTIFAASALLIRIEHVGSKSFAFAVRRLLNPALLREAQRVKLGSAYFWLAAADATENAPAISLRRRQFATAYPELVGTVLHAHQPDDLSSLDHVEQAQRVTLAQAVDRAGPVTPLVRSMRDWPPWVEKTLRGRLTAHSRMALPYYRNRSTPSEPVGDAIARLLSQLGPAWRPRRGDEAIVGYLSQLMGRLALDARSLAALCPSPGQGASPWKRAWRALPASVHRTAGGTRAPDLSGLLSYDRIGEEITDAMGAFEADVMTPLLCGQRPRQDDANPLDPFSIDCSNPLRSVSLVSLLRIAEQYHQRLNAIRHAKDQTSGSEWDERLCWTALFAPFSLRAGRLEIRCLTDVAQLRAHAVELDHCVDQYAFDCVSGQCHIVGLFEKGRDLATAEIQDNGDAGVSMAA
jgi:hypothetical protein